MDLVSLAPQPQQISNKITTGRAIYTTQEPDKFHEAVMNTLVIENTEPAEKVNYLTAIAPFRRKAGGSDWAFETLVCESGVGVAATRDDQREMWLFNTGVGIVSGAGTSDAAWCYCEGSTAAPQHLRTGGV